MMHKEDRSNAVDHSDLMANHVGELEVPVHASEKLALVWREMQPQVLVRIGVMGMESLCLQIIRMRDAQQRIDAEGMIVADSKGSPIPHPAIAIERAAAAQVRSWLMKYGSTP
jgi:phage terminase small subunit